MKQKLRFDFVLLNEYLIKHTSFLYKLSSLTVFLLILFAGTASAQMLQQWNVFASTEGSTAQVFSGSALDDESNLYLLGSQDSPGGERTLTLMKYDANGQKVWHRKLENVYYSKREFPISLKVGKQGDIYVLALTSLNNGGQGLLFYKVSADGVTQWMTPYTYRFAGIDRAYDFELSANDDIFVAGFCSTTQGHDMFALRINKAGKLTWETRLDNIRGHSTYGPTLALDPAGDPYIAVRGMILSQDVRPYPLLLKLDGASGQVIATKKYTEPEMGGDGDGADPRQLHINAEGMIYTVSQTTIGYQYAILLTKADADGNMIWSTVENLDGAGSIVKWDMRVDAEENLILFGAHRSAFTMKYTKDGKRDWIKSYKDGAEISARSVAVDAKGHIAVTGSALNLEKMKSEMLLLFYSPQGELLMEEKSDTIQGQLVMFDVQSNLYLSGTGTAEGRSKIVTIKYGTGTATCDIPVAVKLILPPGGQQVGKPVSTTAMLEADKLPANVTARWLWGDGATSDAYHTAGANQVTGQHTYSSTGVYLPRLEFTDACLESTGPENTQPLAIYDPNAGFVTGGGWFTPSGIPGQVKVQFDFNIRYKEQSKDNLQLTGATSFKLSNALRFESTSYDWLVLQEDKAVWQGSGQINGRGNFGFTVSVVDAGEGKQKSEDMLRLRIWDKHEGNKLYYDSHATADFAYFLSDKGPAIGGGNIVIHSKDNLYAEKKNSLDAQEVLANELTAYPNPFAGTSTLRFELKEQGSYTVALYDMKGVLVQELRQGSAQAYELVEVQVDASSLPKGVYLARLVTDNETKSVKMVVQK